MSRTPSVTLADMQNAFRAAKENGFDVKKCVVTPKKIELVFIDSNDQDADSVDDLEANTCDEVFGCEE